MGGGEFTANLRAPRAFEWQLYGARQNNERVAEPASFPTLAMLADFLLMLLMLTGVLVGAGLVFLIITRTSCVKAWTSRVGGRENFR